MRMTLGEMLKRFRIEKEVKIEEICEGLCDKAMISYYEKGKGTPDTLLFTRIMERMGVSPEYFSIMVSEKERQYHLWKEKVYEAIENEQWELVGSYLEEEIAISNECNEKLVRQFYDYTKAMYLGTTVKKYYEAAKLLEHAIACSLPDVENILHSNTMIGTTELHMLALYLYYGVLANILDKNAGRKLFQEIEEYVFRGRMERSEQAKIYPKLVCIGLEVLKDNFDIKEQMNMCHIAVELLRKDKSFYDITTLLEEYILLLKTTKNENVCFYEKQYKMFCEILLEGGASVSFRPENLPIRMPKFYIISEYLYSKRKEKNMTQEVLSEGICEPETYSRLERGVRTPSKKNFVALADRLDINWHYYRGELDSCNVEAYRLRRQYRDAWLEGHYEKGLEVLKKLENVLDMESPVNIQTIKSSECMLHFFLRQRTQEETYEALKSLLELTTKLDTETEFLVYYSQTELEMITHMARMLRDMGKSNDGIYLLETVLTQMLRSEVGLECQWNGADFALRVLSGLYFSVGKYEKANEILRYVYRVNTKIRSGANFPTILDSIADNLEHIGEQYSEAYKKLYRQTYYVSDFYHIHYIRDYTDEYYRRHFDSSICWYD